MGAMLLAQSEKESGPKSAFHVSPVSCGLSTC